MRNLLATTLAAGALLTANVGTALADPGDPVDQGVTTALVPDALIEEAEGDMGDAPVFDEQPGLCSDAPVYDPSADLDRDACVTPTD
ncbi:MAG: hypothetical protein ACRDNG_00245 [Gaiellaceae bacterium]